MLTDYFLIRRGNIHLTDLFSLSPSGRYFYIRGVNMRALAAFVVGFLLPLPGFVGSFGHNVSAAATRMFDLGWVLSFVTGGVAYLVTCAVWKVPDHDENRSIAFEAKAVLDSTCTVHGTAIVDDGSVAEGTLRGEESTKKEGMKLCV